MRTCFSLVVTKFTWIDAVFRFLLDKGITFESPIAKVSKLPMCLLKKGAAASSLAPSGSFPSGPVC